LIDKDMMTKTAGNPANNNKFNTFMVAVTIQTIRLVQYWSYTY